MSERTLGKARGLNSIADPADFKGSRGRRGRGQNPPPPRPEDRTNATDPGAAEAPGSGDDGAPAGTAAASEGASPQPVGAQQTPHRAVVPGLQRKRRELSIPVPVAEALASTGINPADVVMSAYRTHSDAIFAGAGGRMMSRGRQRLRLSISDAEFDKLTRLGQARGWNRSETVAVLLTMALVDPEDSAGATP